MEFVARVLVEIPDPRRHALPRRLSNATRGKRRKAAASAEPSSPDQAPEEGQSLDRLIPEGGLPPGRILEIATALADALAAADENGIVHRDLKPADVMVTKDGREGK